MKKRIVVRINDRRIWNPMSTAAEICLSLTQYPEVELFFDNEAPLISQTELPEFFETLSRYDVDLSRIIVTTGNLKEPYTGVKITKDARAMFELSEFQKVCDQLPSHKNIQYHFGSLVSRCTMPRLVLSSYLWANHRQRTFQTFHWQAHSDYHKTHLELEELTHHYGVNSIEFDEAVALLKHAPLLKEKITTYPIPHPQNLHQACAWYPNFFVDIICESWYGPDTFFLTEKFWRAVSTKTPFIIHGPQWILQDLKQLGFQTFDRWWDEGYSEDPAHHNIIEIKRVIDFLSTKSLDQLEQMYQTMAPVLDHNLAIMKALTLQDFEKIKENPHATR